MECKENVQNRKTNKQEKLQTEIESEEIRKDVKGKNISHLLKIRISGRND